MTDIKISALPTIAQGSVGVATDSIPITQGAVTYKVTPTALVFSSINANSTGSGSVVLSTNPVINAPTGIVKADVGLSNVDNTSDATKNAATATLTNKTLTSPDINGGTVDGAVIGGAVPAAGSFTTLSASGNINASNATSWALYANSGTRSINIATNAGDANYFMGAGAASYYGTTTNNAVVNLVNGVTASALTGAGLSVTGGISASGALTTAGLKEDTSGNLGLGVTPLARNGNLGFIDFQGFGEIGGGLYMATVGLNISTNAYINSGYRYKTSGFAAAQYSQTGDGRHLWSTAPSGTAGQPISFTQAMTLDASGNLLVGTTSYANSNSNSLMLNPGGGIVYIQHASGAISGSSYGVFNYNATQIGSISQSGTTAVLYNTTSDARLKENIADSSDAASLIDALQVRQFDWKSDGSHQRYGFVAQELYEVAPEAVSKPQDPEEMMAVDYSKLVPMLVKEIQSLRARVSQLEGI